MIRFFLLFFSFFLFQNCSHLPNDYLGKDVAHILRAMPKRDRKHLEYFFQELIAWDGFGYVLLGEKPMAFDTTEKNVTPFASLSDFRYFIAPRRIKFNKGFDAWKKYEKLFSLSQFVFFYEPYRHETLIILINKKSFIKIVQQYREDFQKALNREINGEELLEEGFHRALLSDVLRNHDGLIGTLLGYGRDNAFLFHQSSQITSEGEMTDFSEKFHFGLAWTDEEYDAFHKKFESVSWISKYITGSHLKNLELMALPGFAAVFDSPETQALRKHYLETKNKIIEFYKDKDFLETTLRLLTSQSG